MNNERKPRAIVFGLGVVFVLGVSSFALAFMAFPSRLSQPFNLLPAKSLSDISFSQGLTTELLTDSKDTDKDGIPDIQELQVYGTSPFLPDSDSDGFGDKQEIDNGEDPNCPAGTDCRGSIMPSASDVSQLKLPQELYDASAISSITKSGIPGVTDAATLRKLLKEYGIPPGVIDKIDDETLVKMAQESAAVPAPALKPQSSLPEDPTPEQIKQLLISGGLDKGVVDSLNDKQLVEVYKSALKDFQKTP